MYPEPEPRHMKSRWPAEPRCSIQDLSSELIFLIMDHLPFPTQLDLARTCKRLAVSSRGVLKRHQDSYAKYRVASDLDPATVPLLLRSAFGPGDPIPAWHVRSFEVWRDRTTWSEWQTFDLRAPFASGPDNTLSRPRVSREDVRRYLYWFEQQVGEDLDFELIEKLLEQIESGHDGLLKALLFAKLTRLEDLKFVTREQKAGSCLSCVKVLVAECIKKIEAVEAKTPCGRCENCSDRSQDRENGQAGLRNSESNNPSNTTTPWPVGFYSIQRVAVGVTSRTWMDDDRAEEPCSFLFSHLLRLPSLDSIFFNKLCAYSDGWDMEYDSEEEECGYEVLPEGSSSVKHIFLHGSSGIFGEEERDLWAGPKQLLTMSIRFDGTDEFDCSTSTASTVADTQKSSLQSLMWYGYTNGWNGMPRNIVGDHCTILDNEELARFRRLPAIRHFTMCVNDIELYNYHAGYGDSDEDGSSDDEDDVSEGSNDDDDDEHQANIKRISTMFPRTMETLVLWDDADEDTTRLLEAGLIRMIQSGRYKNLKAIFTEPAERATGYTRKIESWFQDVIAAGKEAGVDIYTLSNQESRHPIDFAEAPDEYDLYSGIHAGVRPSGWSFDPYLGRRIPSGSKSERYHMLWANLKAEREALWKKNDMDLDEL